MSDVDISPERVEELASLLEKTFPVGHVRPVPENSRFAAMGRREDIHSAASILRAQSAVITATQEKLAAAESERDRVLTEKDKLKAQMRGWHDQVYVEGIQMRALPDTTFGEPVDPIPAITPKRLTDLLDKLTTAQAQIDAARNEGLRMALEIARDRTPEKHAGTLSAHVTGTSIATAIEALISIPPAPVRDDAWALRLIRFTISQFNLKGPFGKLDGPLDTDAPDVLFNFNTQDNSNE